MLSIPINYCCVRGRCWLQVSYLSLSFNKTVFQLTKFFIILKPQNLTEKRLGPHNVAHLTKSFEQSIVGNNIRPDATPPAVLHQNQGMIHQSCFTIPINQCVEAYNIFWNTPIN
ncbi:hypothetical protein AAHE18_06G262800 [Arachis hypogaea]